VPLGFYTCETQIAIKIRHPCPAEDWLARAAGSGFARSGQENLRIRDARE